MGIIAGIHKSLNRDEAARRLSVMLDVQSHRDPSGAVVSHVTNGLAIGGINHFDKRSEIHRNSQVYAYVDGIVLHSPFQQYTSHSDVVIASYEKWGLDFMNHLEGEFACAVLDDAKKRLILARDPHGHKPLHYCHHNSDSLVFSSEIKGILAAGIAAEIDLVNFSDFLTLNNIPYPGTIFQNIFQVEPGSLVIFEHNEIKVKKYWHHTIAVDETVSLSEAVEQIGPILKDAVAKRMVTDNTYCFLSGGIDSSAIVSYAAEIGGREVHTVSIGFEEEEENELEDAAIMARHVGAKHHSLVVRPESFFDILETLVLHHDIPFTDTSAYPTYFAGKVGASLTDVILTGDGPDQSMGGSGHYVFAVKNDIFAPRSYSSRFAAGIAARILEKMVSTPTPSLPAKALRKIYRDSLPPIQAAYELRSYFPDLVKKFLCNEQLWQIHRNHNPYRHPEKWFSEAQGNDIINTYLYADLNFYVPDDLMIKVDRMCMAHGLETLSPFQDIHLAERVNKLPGAYKIHQQEGRVKTKYILKEICHNRFPERITDKVKQGFAIPLEKWLRKDNGKFVKEILLDPVTLGRPYFRKEALEHMVSVFVSGKGDYFYPSPNAIAGLLTFELWHRNYIG